MKRLSFVIVDDFSIENTKLMLIRQNPTNGMKDDNKQTRRRFLKATGGIAAAAALAGCSGGSGTNSNGSGGGNNSGGGGGNASGSGDKSTKAGGESGGSKSEGTQQSDIKADPSKTLQLINATITTLDPIAATDTASGRVIQQMFDALMMYPDANTAVEPKLTSDYSTSKDNTTYTFKLKDATFHNGKEVTAQDFIYAWERLAQSENSKRAYFILDSVGVKHETMKKGGDEVYKPNSLALSAPDKKTLKVELTEPFHSTLAMFAYTAFAAVPEGLVGDIKGVSGKVPYKKFANGPIGAGPFKFKKYEPGTQAEVERFDDYYDGKASIAGVHWQVIAKSTAQYQYSIGKNSDVAQIPTAQYDPSKITIKRGPDDQGRKFGTYGPLKNGETTSYTKVPTINTYYLGFNMIKVPKPVRQAFAYVANQKQLTEQVFKGRGQPAYHLTPPAIYPSGAKAYKKHAKQNYPYGYNKLQISKARKVMKDAGYGPNNKFTVNWTQYQDPTWLKLGKLFRDQLSSAYINMKINQADFSTLLERGRSGKLGVYTLGWVADWPAPDNFLQLLNPPQTDTSKPAPLSYINWEPKYGDAAKKAEKAYDKILKNTGPTDKAQKIRNKAYVTMEEANWEDVGFLNLYHQVSERFEYDWVDINTFGAMDKSRQKYESVKIAKNRG